MAILYYKDEYVKLIHGECLSVMDKLINKNIKFDAIITDPPYGTTSCKWDTIIPLEKMWDKLNQLSNDNTPIVLFGSEPFSSNLRMGNIKNYKHEWIWDKKIGANFVQAKKHPLKVVENIIVFSKKTVNYYPQMTNRTEDEIETLKAKDKKKETTRMQNVEDKYFKMASGKFESSKPFDLAYPKNILSYNKFYNECNSKHRLHPTQKPVELMEYLIKTYTNEGDTILDFTCGSGTTLVAAKNLNRKAVGIELEEKYCEVSKNRLEENNNKIITNQ